MSTAIANLPKATTFPALLKQYQTEIARALPRHLSPDRMTRIALTEFRKNPKLGECDPRSVFAAVIMASQLGLEPGVMGQCYLIPFKTECQLIPGYQGLLDLVRRTGKVKRIESQVVYTGDRFLYRTGLSITLEHEPLLDGDRGEPRLAYALAEFAEGGYHVEIMARREIESIRDRSQNVINARKWGKKTPWDTDTDEMWRKTVLRRLCKFLPKSVELATALSLDDTASQGSQQMNVRDAIEGSWAPAPVPNEPPIPDLPPPPPEMNTETGELPAPPPEPTPAPDLPPPDPGAELLPRIAEAPSIPDLNALNQAIGRLRNGDRTRAVAAWKARKAALLEAMAASMAGK